MQIIIESADIQKVSTQIEEMVLKSVNTLPLMATIGTILHQSIDKNFENQGRPSKWKPLSPFTIKLYEGQAIDKARATKAWQKAGERGRAGQESRRIAKDVHGGKLLAQSGQLKKSITIGEITNTSVEIGSSLVYARIHQLGGTILPRRFDALYIPFGKGYKKVHKTTIPARPYLVMQNEDETFILRAVEAYLMK